ncbi:carbohydrate-binding domain-containing protein, partial [Methylobacterium sp. WL116]|uniref:carbohydrate-binding domain-containing protein n=1 Tax=Methylobacterium sp. WL116 TaxID=2603889 RepID=UPI0011C7A116
VEHYGGNDKGVYSTIHTTDQTPNIPWQQNRQVYSETAQASGYHTYGMDWQKDKISFYVDGEFVGSQATPSDMTGPMYLVANLATQNDADAAGVPIATRIDYIRAYSNNPNAVAVTQDPVSAPDGQDPGLYGATSINHPLSSKVVSTPTSTSIGSGSDQLIFKISEDAYKGDAQYTVSVDGKQIGGTLTAHAAHTAGQSDTVTVNGDWAAGDHKVSINFLNDAYDGTASTDRNLYIDSVTYNGTAVSGSHLSLMSAGAQIVTVHDTTAVPTPAAPVSTLVSTPTSTSIGSGSDQLIFKISEDAYKGDAQYTVSVDGKQIGGTLTAHAAHTAGQSDTVTVNGDWAAGDHKVSINFLNDDYATPYTPSTDRNLHVDSATYNGTDVSGSKIALMSAGAQTITVHDTTAMPTASTATPAASASTPTVTSIGSGSDKLVLKISEDAYKGDALYTVSVDGKQIGGTLTAHAAHTAGQSDTVTVNGDWAAGDHKVSINFLNDDYATPYTPSTDRNLYVDSATYNGTDVSGSHLSLMSAGAQIVTVHDYGLL